MQHTTDTAFNQLCNAVLDGRATQGQIDELQRLTLASPERLKRYTELAAIHGGLTVLCRDGLEAAQTVAPAATTISTRKDRPGAAHLRRLAVAAVTIAVLLTLPLWSLLVRNDEFATVHSAESCLWEQAPVAMVSGQRIGAGHLHLAKGIARIVFDDGTQVDLEGPVEAELLADGRCRVSTGNLVVSEGRPGFVVETPHAKLTDQGTSFGVSVERDGESLLEVFDGRVDVEHNMSGEKFSVEELQSVRLGTTGIASGSTGDKTGRARQKKSLRVVQITTAVGDGTDSWVQRDESLREPSDDILLAKDARSDFDAWDRRVLLRFDLSNVRDEAVRRCSLQLTATPSGIGYASRTPDSVFGVYGILNRAEWDRSSVRWDSTPGMADDTFVDGQSLRLGEFVIPKGQKSGSFVIENSELTNLIRRRAGSTLTLIVLCETEETKSNGLAHGFASARHATLPPPTLRIWSKGRR